MRTSSTHLNGNFLPMKNIQFSDSELIAMRSFYESELQVTLKKLEHLRDVLSKLNKDSIHIDININESKKNAPIPSVAPLVVKTNSIKKNEWS